MTCISARPSSRTTIHYNEIAAGHDSFSPFEKCVFHWLELYRYILEFRARSDFRIWKFEELYGPDQAWKDFYRELSGVTFDALPPRKDNHRHAVELSGGFAVRPALAEACKALCTELGYDDAFIGGLDGKLTALQEKYAEAAR